MKIITYIPLFLIVIFSIGLRLIYLDRVPIGISNDELDYILNAKAVFLTGKDISGTWSPFSLSTPPYEIPKAELPYLIISPFVGLMNFSLFSARLPYAIFSVFLVIVLYLITEKLLGKSQAFIVGLVTSINPWSIYFGRTAYEAPLAIFFFFLAFYILIITKGWKVLFTFIPLFIGFYLYIGTKLIFIPYVSLIILYSWYGKHQKKYLKQHLLLFILCLSLFSYFVFSFIYQPTGTRLSELSTLNSPMISNAVNAERRLSIKTPLTNLFSNKIVVWGKDSIDKYLRVFSTSFLFLNGEERSTFSLWYHGYFYYLDFFFLLIGFCILFVRKRSLWFLLSVLIFIAPLPTVVSNVGSGFAALRSSLLYPLFMVLIGLGIWYVVFLNKHKIYIVSVSVLLLFLYAIQLTNFLNIYFFRNPIYNSEGFGFSQRILSKYIQLSQKANQNIFVITNEKDSIPSIYKQYLFYTNSYNKYSAKEIAQDIKIGAFKYKNVEFINCPKSISPKSTVITTHGSKCKSINKNSKTLSMPQLSDGGEIYRIYNDELCKKYRLKRYPQDLKLKDFEVEKLSESEFCTKFITNLN